LRRLNGLLHWYKLLMFLFVSENAVQLLFDAQGRYLVTCGEKFVKIFHNVTGHKASAALAKAKLHQAGLSAATKERLELQIETAEALVASLS